MSIPPRFSPEQIDYLEDFIFNKLTILSLEFKRLYKLTRRDFERTRAKLDAMRQILRDEETGHCDENQGKN